MLLGVGSVSRLAKVCDEIVRDEDARMEDTLGKLDINWDLYISLEKSGFILLVTAEKMNTVAGFGLYTVFNHPHHPYARVGQCAMLNVRVAWRGNHVGRMIVEFAMPELKLRGCTHIQHGHRPIYGAEPLFPKIGFTEFDRFYIKELN